MNLSKLHEAFATVRDPTCTDSPYDDGLTPTYDEVDGISPSKFDENLNKRSLPYHFVHRKNTSSVGDKLSFLSSGSHRSVASMQVYKKEFSQSVIDPEIIYRKPVKSSVQVLE